MERWNDYVFTDSVITDYPNTPKQQYPIRRKNRDEFSGSVPGVNRVGRCVDDRDIETSPTVTGEETTENSDSL